jgi:hypothetical protein
MNTKSRLEKPKPESWRRTTSGTQELPNRTGLPDGLKSGVETLSGLSLDDVRVHYHSSRPAQLQALAFTQGTEIHVASGQERHIPHEAWHVVQQKRGQVKATGTIGNLALNDEPQLELEADAMGREATRRNTHQRRGMGPAIQGGNAPMQFARPDQGLHRAGIGGLIGAGVGGLVGLGIGGPVGAGLGMMVGGGLGAGIGLLSGLFWGKRKEPAAWATQRMDDLLGFIQRIPAVERRAYRDDPEVRTNIQKRSKAEATILMGALMQGSLQYNKLSGSDFLNIFITGSGEAELDETQSANCWEFIMYSAWLAGKLDANEIREMHANNGMKDVSFFSKGTQIARPYTTLGLDFNTSQKYSDTNQPQPGDLVFEVDKKRKQNRVDHVMLSLGGNKLLSHNSAGKVVEQTTIEQQNLGNFYDFYFNSPPW